MPTPPESDIAFLLDILGGALTDPLRRSDVVGAFAGLRPLLDDGTDKTADVSRRHAIAISPDGIVTVVGGKLTTYRAMARQAVDAANQRHQLGAPASTTHRRPLVGAADRSVLAAVDAPSTMVRRFGTEAAGIAALARAEPDLAAPLAPGLETTGAELVWSLRHEGALTVDDLLDRRTRIGLVPADRAAALPTATEILATYA